MTHIPQWAKLQMDFRAKVHEERRQELEHIEAKKLNPLLSDFVRSDDYQWQVEQQEKNAKYSAPGGKELQIEDRKKEGKEIFELIENQRKIKSLEYAKVEAYHVLHGPASEADAAARLAICMACPDRAVEYKGQTDAGGVGWCTQCGCGSNPRALLTVKVTLAGYECPLTPPKWGKVEGTGASVASTVDAVAGVAKSIIHKLSGG